MRGLRLSFSIAFAMVFVLLGFWVGFTHHQAPAVMAASNYNPRTGDPCALYVRTTTPINLTASGQLVTGVAGKQTYVCSMLISNAGAQNVAIVEGTGATCGTNTVGMAGGNAAATGLQLGALQTIWFGPPGSFSIPTLTTGDNICLLLSAATQVSGYIQYAQY